MTLTALLQYARTTPLTASHSQKMKEDGAGLLPLHRLPTDNASKSTSKGQNLFILSSSMMNLVTTIPTPTMMTAALIK